MSSFQKDSWIWIQNEEDRFLPAKVLTTFTKGIINK